jgi:hypothetical protein
LILLRMSWAKRGVQSQNSDRFESQNSGRVQSDRP